MYPATERRWDEARKVPQADLLNSRGNVHYGFTADEFTVLLILAGFNPACFDISGFQENGAFLGILRVANTEAFHQTALFDPHIGIRMLLKATPRGSHRVSVQQCLNLALGIITTGQEKSRQPWLILPEGVPSEDSRIWTEDPKIKSRIEDFSLGTGSAYLKYRVSPEELDRFRAHVLSDKDAVPDLRHAYVVGLALTSLRPWALLALLPAGLRALAPPLAFLALADAPPPDDLAERMRDLRNPPPMGWHNREERLAVLRKLGDVRVDHFHGSSNYCAWYHDAMCDLFKHNRLHVVQVRQAMAAACAADVLGARGNTDLAARIEDFFILAQAQPGFAAAQGGKAVAEVPQWAIVMYARFVWSWLHDSIPADFSKRRFRRRVFLG